VSWLGEFRRVSAVLLEEIRATPEEAYDRVAILDDMLDLDRAWQRLAALMDRAEFPLNPITAGTPYPDERHAFGRDADSRALTTEQVAAAAEHLSLTAFAVLGAHLRPLLDAEAWIPIPDPNAPMLGVSPPAEVDTYQVSAETERAIRSTLAASYAEMVTFFAVAAEEGQCTVFWAE
jgi:hypothetical protein